MRSSAQLVVAWVVDSEADLWRALARGVDAVISNRPLALLEALRRTWTENCS
jgi:glycerophosphoryl diester phosphodiesterase